VAEGARIATRANRHGRRTGSVLTVTRAEACPTCGRPVDEHDRHIRFQRPDVVFAMSEADLAGKVWGDDPLLQVDDVGCFIRTLLPVRLTGGYTVTFGAWLLVAPEVLHHAWSVWHAPEYLDLEVEGDLANALPRWGAGVVGKHVWTEVRDADEIPYVCASDDPLVSRLLTDAWAHDEVLPHLPG